MDDIIVDSDKDTEHILSHKTIFVNPTNEEYLKLSNEFKKKLDESQGEFFFQLGKGENESPGLSDNEICESFKVIEKIVIENKSSVIKLRDILCPDGKVVEYIIRKIPEMNDFMDIRVAVVGNVDAGKSTLLGVLTHGDLDNGRGAARKKLFRHIHEIESGRTSSVGNDILGFDEKGEIVNKSVHGQLDWAKICEKSSKVITFIDLAGHEKYLKTTVFGMTGHAPDFAMLIIGANAGIIGMTKEHLGLALALNVPVFVVVTKIDMCPPNIMQETMNLMTRVLKSPGCRKMPVVVSNEDDVVCSATNFITERVCPIFCVSNVTGENMHLLQSFLNLLSPHTNPRINDPAEFQIDDIFSVPGVGTVVSGTCLKGTIRVNDVLLLGPDPLGFFSPHPIKSIHRKRMPVKEVRGSQSASFSLKKIKRNQIRKGMMMLSPLLDPKSSWEFSADLLILHHPTTISVKYQAMVHIGPVRQTATIIAMSQDHLRTGDKAEVRFRFIKNPEYIKTGVRLVFREGKTKAVGTVTQVYHYATGVAQNLRHRNTKKENSGKE